MNLFAVNSLFDVSGSRHFRLSSVSRLSIVLFLGAMLVVLSGMSVFGANPSSENGDASTSLKTADSRAVRLSSVEGDVRVVQDGEVIADPAFANLPLFEGSEISTGNEGRAELQFEDGSVVRLSPNTSIALTVLQQQGTGTRTELVMNNGLAYFELQPSVSAHSLRVNYGPDGFSATSFAVIRVTADAQPASLAVFSGNIHLTHGENFQGDVHSGQSVSLDGSNSAYSVAESIEPDSWDNWNFDRDQVLNSEAADRTAATGSLKDFPNVGLSDLDASGNWYSVPGQGYVWSPYDAQLEGASWDPYGYGHWVYYPRFGYVWVSDYTWGYAPFQCGLWNYFDDFGWGWAPGAGCNPWWGEGFYGGYGGGGGWGFRLGNYPPGYHPPRRPPGPIHPRPGPHPVQNPGQHPIQVRGGPVRPPIGVDHRTGHATELTLTTTHPQGPVTIAGRTVEPLRPIAPREAYGSPSGGTTFVNRAEPPQSGRYGTGNPVYPARSIPGQNPGQSGARPYSPPASHPQPARPPSSGGGGSGGHMPSGGGGGSAPHSAPAPHK